MRDINEIALDKAAREGYAVRCKTNGPRILDKYASDNIMAMQIADARVIVEAYLSAATDTVRVPDGWQLVPKEPTKVMLDTFHDTIRILVTPAQQEAEVLNDKGLWAAVLSAAPEPPK